MMNVAASNDGAGGSDRDRMPAVGVLSVHPAPYRDPVHVELFRQCPSLQILHFHTLDKGHSEWNLQRDPLDRSTFAGTRRTGRLALAVDVVRWLRAGRFDVVVVPGYATVPSMAALLFCMATATPFILSLDTVATGIGTGLIGAAKRWLLARAAGLWVPGRASRRYFESQGWPAQAVAEGSYCLDVQSIAEAVDQARSRRAELRRSYGIADDASVFLSVGKLIPARRMAELAARFSASADLRESRLIVVGDGVEEPALRSIAARSPAVLHIPRLPFAGLRDVYAMSDVYVHAGAEPYSTACEYAAAAGLALILSTRVGYWADLAERTEGSGFASFESEEALVPALQAYASGRRAGPSAEDLGRIRQRTPAWASRQLLDLLSAVVASDRRPVASRPIHDESGT